MLKNQENLDNYFEVAMTETADKLVIETSLFWQISKNGLRKIELSSPREQSNEKTGRFDERFINNISDNNMKTGILTLHIPNKGQ